MKLITTNELAELTGFCKSSLWRYRRRYPDFPKPITLNGIHVRWNLEEIEAWFLSRRESQDD